MFYSLTGKVVKKNLYGFAISCSGVAFWCQCSENTSQEIEQGKEATVYTYMVVREGAIDLVGFSTEAELEWFKLLTTVSSVGTKVALSILSVLTPDNLALSISAGDFRAITKANGVGPKVAQRIINELKDKAGAVGGSEEIISVAGVSDNSAKSEAVAALTVLGYSQTDASVAVSRLDPSLGVDEMIKLALKALTRFN